MIDTLLLFEISKSLIVSSQTFNGYSQHTKGIACDILSNHFHALEIMRIALELKFTGIGVNQKGNSRFIHLDIADHSEERPRPTVWSY